MDDSIRVQFTTGLDDLVDANVRMVQGTRWAARRRAGVIWATPVAFTVTLFAVVVVGTGMSATTDLLAVAGVAALLAIPVGLLNRSVYDSRVRGQVRGFLEEMLGDRTTWQCEIELRPETAWSRGPGAEMAFPWAEATGIEDADDAVVLRFRGGIIVARNRAFPTAEDRARFIETARSSMRR